MIGRFIVAMIASLPSDVVALLSDANGLRVRANQAMPADANQDRVVYSVVDAPRLHSLSGPSGLASPRVQLSIISGGSAPQDYSRICRIARLIAGTKNDPRMNGFSGTRGGIDVRACTLMDERDVMIQPQFGEMVGPYEIQQDYEIWWDEAAAAVA